VIKAVSTDRIRIYARDLAIGSVTNVSVFRMNRGDWIYDPDYTNDGVLNYRSILTDESTNNEKQFTLDTSITDGGWNGRSLHCQVIINDTVSEDLNAGEIFLKQPLFLEGFYQMEVRGYIYNYFRILGKNLAHLERASTEDGYNRFESYNDTVTYKAYEE
jgi:hypothetical protein